jgi:hypothetical protein
MYPSPPNILWVPASKVLTEVDRNCNRSQMLSVKRNPVAPLKNYKPGFTTSNTPYLNGNLNK